MASGVETSLNDLAARCRAVMGVQRARAGVRAGARRSTRCRGGWPRPRRRERCSASSQRRCCSRKGYRGLVAWWRARARAERDRRVALTDSDRAAVAGRARGRGGAARHPVRLGHAGAGGGRLRAASSRPPSARRTRAPSPAARRRCTSRCWRCGVGPGDEVVTVSHSFIATANAIRYCGATPVFVDVEPDTFNIDPHCVDAAISPRHEGDPGRASARDAVRPRRDRCRSRAARPAGDRGRGLRHRQRDPAGRASGSGSAGRTATSPASRSTRASCCRPATAAC